MKYYNAFGEPGYHSAFLTTFSFSAQAFEDIAFSKLRGAGCRNVAVLADQSMVNMSIEEFGAPRFAGSLYHLAKVSVPGAFHPKITLLLGEKKGRLLIGSANLTALGMAGNKELISDLVYTPEEPEPLPIFQSVFEFITAYAPSQDPWFPVAKERALEQSPWLMDDSSGERMASPEGLRFICDGEDETVLEQIGAAIGDDTIERLVVMSPFWDRKLEGLKKLREMLGSPSTDVLIEKARGEFPASSLKSGAGVELFDVEDKGKPRSNHAKLFVALGREWDHVISGSVNCTVPALLGRSVARGNAEAAIYTRVPTGTALEKLGLADYREEPIDLSFLSDPIALETDDDKREPIEAGTFELRGNKLSWIPPNGRLTVPAAVKVHDTLGESLWDDFTVKSVERTSWYLDLSLTRPKTARLCFPDGRLSASGIVIDFDVLAPATLPSKAGKKAKVADQLLGTTSEDLALVGFLAELEAIEMDEIGSLDAKFGKGRQCQDDESDARPFVTLSYDDFVKARERAEATKEREAAFIVGRSNRAADLVSSCLNRLIGLVSRDLSEEEDAELQRVATQDPTQQEPQEPAENGPTDSASEEQEDNDVKQAKERSRDYTKKIAEAVAAFESRAKALRGRSITSIELVRLRLLLQIILNYAEPVAGGLGRRNALPISDKSNHGWPRLIGRLLMQHFGTFRALQDIRLEEDENEQDRILEYLAVAYFAAQVAKQAVEGHPRADVLRKPMDRLAVDIAQQSSLTINGRKKDQEYFGTMLQRLEGRFCESLGTSPVPPLGE